jgi:3-oxoacyl-[acyl-carrier protein] reductase
MTYNIDLTGKVAIITGAAKGIGLASTSILTKAGAQVVIDDILKEEQMTPVLNQVAQEGLIPWYIREDISFQENAERMVQRTLAKFGRVDILVNNAGVVAGWQKSMDVHVMGTYFCSEAVKNHMSERGEGRIINLTSTCVFSGGTGIPQYVASKGGTFALTRYLARTYAPLGILVNGIMPAVVMSDMIMTRYASAEEMIEHYKPLMPIGRIGYPEDIAGIVLFLASELSSFLVGEILVADGGRMHVGV